MGKTLAVSALFHLAVAGWIAWPHGRGNDPQHRIHAIAVSMVRAEPQAVASPAPAVSSAPAPIPTHHRAPPPPTAPNVVKSTAPAPVAAPADSPRTELSEAPKSGSSEEAPPSGDGSSGSATGTGGAGVGGEVLGLGASKFVARAQRRIVGEEPAYPVEARSRRLTDTVAAKVCIDAEGHVTSVKILASKPPFDTSVLAAIPTWQYEPYSLGGTRIPACFPVYLHFELAN